MMPSSEVTNEWICANPSAARPAAQTDSTILVSVKQETPGRMSDGRVASATLD
jgi:hypothetical protein